MAKRRHLPVLTSGKKYEGWMPFVNDEPVFISFHPPYAKLYATRKDARERAEDVRRVTIIVETNGAKP